VTLDHLLPSNFQVLETLFLEKVFLVLVFQVPA
jgi:hypothetical protein